MTLHKAMELVLRESGRPMSAADLAAEINRRNLYRQKNGNEVPSGQVSARRARHQDCFDLNDGQISLRS